MDYKAGLNMAIKDFEVFLMNSLKKINTEIEEKQVLELLKREGFRELTASERQSDWYKKAIDEFMRAEGHRRVAFIES